MILKARSINLMKLPEERYWHSIVNRAKTEGPEFLIKLSILDIITEKALSYKIRLSNGMAYCFTNIILNSLMVE